MMTLHHQMKTSINQKKEKIIAFEFIKINFKKYFFVKELVELATELFAVCPLITFTIKKPIIKIIKLIIFISSSFFLIFFQI